MLSATFPTEVAIGALGRGGGEGLSCPRSRRAEAAAAPEMALAEAAESRMAAAGPSSPRQIVRAEPAGGAPRGGGIRRNYIRLLPQSAPPPLSLSLAHTHTGAAAAALSAEGSLRAEPLRQTRSHCACAAGRLRGTCSATVGGGEGGRWTTGANCNLKLTDRTAGRCRKLCSLSQTTPPRDKEMLYKLSKRRVFYSKQPSFSPAGCT